VWVWAGGGGLGGGWVVTPPPPVWGVVVFGGVWAPWGVWVCCGDAILPSVDGFSFLAPPPPSEPLHRDLRSLSFSYW